MNAFTTENLSCLFDYTSESPRHWRESLTERKAQGIDRIHCHIPWGAHESVRGIRDFAKTSRLRLERFLKELADVNLTCELIFGFTMGKESFPPWLEGGQHTALIPSGMFYGDRDAHALIRVPSLFDPELAESFASFVAEALSIAHLYQVPNGPVSKIHLDLGFFEHDLNLTESEVYPRYLENRYLDMEALNSAFQTSFRSFASAATPQALRAMFERRPWLAAFDYKWCRHYELKRLRKELLCKEPLAPYAAYLSGGVIEERKRSAWTIWVDATAVEFTREGELFPSFPAQISSPFSIQSFGLIDYVRFHQRQSDLDLCILPLEETQGMQDAKYGIVIAGKYLNRAAYARLESVLHAGGSIFFPFTLPHYDEAMAAYEWGEGSGRVSVKLGDQVWHRSPAKNGFIWSPEAPWIAEDKLWPKLEALKTQVSMAENVS